MWWGFLNMIHVLRVHWKGRPFLRRKKPSGSVQTLQGGSWALYSMQVYRAAKESTKPVAGGFWVLVIPYAYTYYIYTSLGIDVHTYTYNVVLHLNNSAHWIKYLLYLLEIH